MVAGVAVTHRHPFDQPEAEQELAEGYHVEYGGMKWGCSSLRNTSTWFYLCIDRNAILRWLVSAI